MSESDKEESKHSGEQQNTSENEEENFGVNLARFSSDVTPKIQRHTKAETKEEKLLALQK